MDNDLVESVREATAGPAGAIEDIGLRLDNLFHRLRASTMRRWDQSEVLRRYWRLKCFIDANRECYATLLSANPVMLLVPIGGARPLWMIETLGSLYRNQPVVFFLLTYWSLENDKRVDTLRNNAESYSTRFPKHKLVFFCNTTREQDLLVEAGLTALMVHQNQLVSEHTYRPLEGVPVEYDA